MQIIRETGNARYLIRGYARGRITINDKSYNRSLIVAPERLEPDWEPQTWKALRVEHLEPIAALEPEIVLLGSGDRARLPDKAVTTWFLSRKIGVETMDTAAACRTYNVLVGEGRNVAAALIML